MHPLHDYVAKQLAERIKTRQLLVWYDVRREFAPFIAELRGAPKAAGTIAPISVAGISANLGEYEGSFFELRALVEPFVSGDQPDNVILYAPGCERDRRGSVLMEIEKAGDCYEPQLKRLARNALRSRYTDGDIDDLLAPERITYEDLARAAAPKSSSIPPSILKSIFHHVSGNDALLAAWLASDGYDHEIETKEATRELVKLIHARLGAELPQDAPLSKLRAITLRYVLAGEFRSDLRCPPPSSVAAVPAPKTKDEVAAVRELARYLRTKFSDTYPELADRVERELGVRNETIAADKLGAIDTFRFEERALLRHCGELIAEGRFDEAFAVIAERESSYWLDRDFGRKAQWEACRRMAELGSVTTAVRAAMAKIRGGADTWIHAYTEEDGWYRMDQAQRRLELWIANLEEDPEERPLGVVRRSYEDTCHAMAEGFTRAFVNAKWSAPRSLHQTRVYSDVVAQRPKPVAYFLVDAMRFEMGVELSEHLPPSAEVSVRHATCALPSITPVGMSALQPGASTSFSVVEKNKVLGASIEGVFLCDRAARSKFAASRIPKLVDLILDDVLSLTSSKLSKKLEGAQVIVVRSQEIDEAGENTTTRQARRVMDAVLVDIPNAIQRLAKFGVEHSVVSADHGHLFFPVDRDESMRIDKPGGDEVELHRRCWIGRGGATPPSCVRVDAAALGYASDLELVFPRGAGVFKAGGDLAFHHGGPSLQEMIIPVLTVRLRLKPSGRPLPGPIQVTGVPDAVTNRIFSVTLQLGQNLALFASEMTVRPVLMFSGKHVGGVGMASGGELDRTTGCVTLQPGKPTTIGFLLSDDTVPTLRVVMQDPTTDAELYRSPSDIPVRLLG